MTKGPAGRLTYRLYIYPFLFFIQVSQLSGLKQEVW